MQLIKIGIIGAGAVARYHLEALSHIPWMRAVGITSRTRGKAEILGVEFGIPCFNTIEELVESVHPDALMVLVSANQMYSVTMHTCMFGLPLFIEKPAGMIPEENRRLAEIAKSAQIKTMVGFNRRYYSIFHKGLDTINKHGGLLGISIEGHERMWRIREGEKFSNEELDNWIFANSVHTIDLLRFFGGEPRKMFSFAKRKFHEAHGDQFVSIFEFNNEVIGQYNAHWYSPGGWRVVLYGDGVTVEFCPLEKGVIVNKKFEKNIIYPDAIDTLCKPGFIRQMEEFGRLVCHGTYTWPAVDLEDSLKTMQLAENLSILS